MKSLEIYKNEKWYEYTKSIKDKYIQEDFKNAGNNLQNINTLAGDLLRDSESLEDSRAGIYWLLKVMEKYRNGDYEKAGYTPDEEFYLAISTLSAILLPQSEYIFDDIKERSMKYIEEDWSLGFELLSNKVNSKYATETDYLMMTIIYMDGKVVDRDLEKAKEYFGKYKEKSGGKDKQFIAYFEGELIR